MVLHAYEVEQPIFVLTFGSLQNSASWVWIPREDIVCFVYLSQLRSHIGDVGFLPSQLTLVWVVVRCFALSGL